MPPRRRGPWPGSASATGWHRIEISCDVRQRRLGRGGAAGRLTGSRAVAPGGLPARRGTADAAVFARSPTDPDGPVAAGLAGAGRAAPTGWSSLRPMRPEDWPALLAEAQQRRVASLGLSAAEPMTEAAARRALRRGPAWTGWSAAGAAADLRRGHRRRRRHDALRRVGPPGVVGHRLRRAAGVPRPPASPPARCGCWPDWAFEPDRRSSGWNWAARSRNRGLGPVAERAGFVREGRLAGRLRNPDRQLQRRDRPSVCTPRRPD